MTERRPAQGKSPNYGRRMMADLFTCVGESQTMPVRQHVSTNHNPTIERGLSIR